MKKILISTALITSAALGVTACSSVNAATDTASNNQATTLHQDGARHHKRFSNHGGKKPFAELNLSADQETKIKAIMQKHHGARTQNVAAMKTERQAMQSQVQNLANSPALNSAELNRLANLEAEKTRQRFINRVQMQREIAQVLTPEQRQKLATITAERQNKRANHAQKRSQHSKYQPQAAKQ
ncbi:Spy/CpxP family protein refolding chaperone [Psychrobacter ciconiae]|uniref:Spy/CpxP family protein refolding chaperone n=1 Tax=Psychrobacter ciconiae TaxID=1553449 RepID=UPI00191B7B14|nr:Spy/CpxP family protein refolding chaperone [Psychrobacter ciconiae]